MNKDILNESIRLMKDSDILLVNGTPCFFNEYETFDRLEDDIPKCIIIDDYLKDDCEFAIYISEIEEIEILYTAIKIKTKKSSYIINILKVQNLK